MASRLGKLKFLVSRCQFRLTPNSNSNSSLQTLLCTKPFHRRISSSGSWIGQTTSTGTTVQSSSSTSLSTPGSELSASTPPTPAPTTDPDGKPVSRMSRYKTETIKYGKNLLNEYRTVIIEAYQDGVANPTRSTCYLLLLGGVLYLIWSNPTEKSFFTEFTIAREDLDTVGEPVRSPKSEQYVRAMSRLHNRGELRYTDLVLCSVIWRHDHDRELALYEAQCKYLQPTWSEMWDRLIDVGIAGRWWISRRIMLDYDVNEWEWEPKTKIMA